MKIFCLGLVAFMMSVLGLFGCSNGAHGNKPDHLGYQVDQSNLYGIVEPLHSSEVQGFNEDITIDLFHILGVKSYRFQVFLNPIADTSENPNSEVNAGVIATFKRLIKKLTDAGVQQIIMEASLKPWGYEGDNLSFEERDSVNYQQYLLDLSKCWELFAGALPEITYFEMGNEPNLDAFLHKKEYRASTPGTSGKIGVFTKKEKIDIVTDMMFYASKGIYQANSNAIAIMPGISCGFNGMASKELNYFIEDIYKNIQSGNFPFGASKSKKSDDYFKALAWHPYLIGSPLLDKKWVEQNNAVYDVVKQYGDDGKKVFITEMGFSDAGNVERDEMQADFYRTLYGFAKNELPYVESIHSFRLYECKNAANWGGEVEIYYGFFKEKDGGFLPKHKARAIQEIFGGKGDLSKYNHE